MITLADIQTEHFPSQSIIEVRSSARLSSSLRVHKLSQSTERGVQEVIREAQKKTAQNVFAHAYHEVNAELRKICYELEIVSFDTTSPEGQRQLESIRLNLQQLTNKTDPSLFR